MNILLKTQLEGSVEIGELEAECARLQGLVVEFRASNAELLAALEEIASPGQRLSKPIARAAIAKASQREGGGMTFIAACGMTGEALHLAAKKVCEAFSLGPLDAAAMYGPDFNLIEHQNMALAKLASVVDLATREAAG